MNVQAKAASRPTILLAATAAISLSMLYFIMPVAATQPDPLHKVTICHRTNSTSNPYVIITVDEASVDGDNGNDNGQGDHLLEHLGPVFDVNNPPPPPHNGDQWGDIIPPFYSDGTTPTGYPSLNWDAAGMAFFENGCNPPAEESVEQSVEESVEQSVEESVEQSVEESVEQSVEESVAESVEESVAESVEQSVEESVAESAEESFLGGEGTPDPEESSPDTALGVTGSNPLPTILFTLVLLASLTGLAVVNVKAVRNHS